MRRLEKNVDSPWRFKVVITKTLRIIIEVKADNQQQAEQMVSDNWKNGKHILSADNFADVEFETVPVDEQK